MGDLHLIDIRVNPGAYVKDVLFGCWMNLQEGVRKGGGKTIWGFKIIGENRIISIIENAVEAGAEAVNAAFGDHTELSCTPLRSYEGLAEHVLGVDKTLTESSPHRLGNDGRLFWLNFSLEYRGMSLPDFLSSWKAEAQSVLNLRASGKMELDLFKVVGQRNVYLFIKCPNHEIMDDIVFTLPIMKELGNQIHIVTKSIMPLEVSCGQTQD